MSNFVMDLDQRATKHAVVLAAVAQAAGCGVAMALTSGVVLPASPAQLVVACLYTGLSVGMSLRLAAVLQARRLAKH